MCLFVVTGACKAGTTNSLSRRFGAPLTLCMPALRLFKVLSAHMFDVGNGNLTLALVPLAIIRTTSAYEYLINSHLNPFTAVETVTAVEQHAAPDLEPDGPRCTG